MVTVLIAGGGTGGHVYPMLAVGDAVRAEDSSARVVYVGTPRGIEGKAIGGIGEELCMLDIAPLRGDGVGGFVKGVARAAGSIPEARALVRRLQPDVALSAGGYAGGPIALAARLYGVPVALLEPNSVLGLSNRLLTPFAERAYVAFPEAERFLRPSTVRRLGVPLRRAFAPARYAAKEGPMRLLVLGGSQGAKGINEVVPRALAALAAGVEVRVTHQTGRDRDAEVRALYESLGLGSRAEVVPFIDDVAAALGGADLVLGRAGASSLAELCAVGRASLLIPFPFAADDHQHKNARSLERAGAAITIAQSDATPARLGSEITSLAHDPARRESMAHAAMELGRPSAARAVARDVLELAARHARRGQEGLLVFRGRVRHVHFVGVGGVGMSGLAEILRTLEFDVSGSDMKESSTTRRLETLGVRIDIGHRFENISGVDVVVYSSAIRPNPELTEARALGIPVITRAEMLAELMRVKYGVAIAGSHGKTTTTSLVATVLRAAGLNPTVVVGGKMAALGSNARLGAGDLLVAEADESDGSFLRLTPTIAVVTNIDAEHLDHYGSHEKLKDAFVEFAARVPFYGLAVLCLDHPHVQDILPRIPRRHVTYGISPQSDYSARGIQFRGLETSFHAYRRGEPLGGFTVRMPGAHNVLNCLATIAVADELEVPLDVTKQALSTFGGVARRFTIVGTAGGVTLVDDYGHHPAEVRATIDAARRAYPAEGNRVVVAFQPHRHTRTRDLFDDFTRAFNLADVLLVTDIYPAGEAPIPGISAEKLVQAIREHGHHDASYVHDKNDLPDVLEKIVRPGDVVIALGAGDINASVRALKTRLEARDLGKTPVPGSVREAPR